MAAVARECKLIVRDLAPSVELAQKGDPNALLKLIDGADINCSRSYICKACGETYYNHGWGTPTNGILLSCSLTARSLSLLSRSE